MPPRSIAQVPRGMWLDVDGDKDGRADHKKRPDGTPQNGRTKLGRKASGDDIIKDTVRQVDSGTAVGHTSRPREVDGSGKKRRITIQCAEPKRRKSKGQIGRR